MADYLTRDTVESVALNTAIPFLDLNPCSNGNVIHQNGSGIFILRGKGDCVSTYDVKFTGNIPMKTQTIFTVTNHSDLSLNMR
jgi:hypothetical protein